MRAEGGQGLGSGAQLRTVYQTRVPLESRDRVTCLERRGVCAMGEFRRREVSNSHFGGQESKLTRKTW